MSAASPLDRFVQAQDPVIADVRRELRAGLKRSHWMWFVFPQLRGLGHSAMAWEYGLASRQEAEQYQAHPVLGPRLRECTALVNAVVSRSIGQILGSPDDMKFRSSMTLFATVAPGELLFRQALDRFFADGRDPLTLQKLDG